jgi:hypothetical protein
MAKLLHAAADSAIPAQNRMCEIVNNVFITCYLTMFHVTQKQTRENVVVALARSFS